MRNGIIAKQMLPTFAVCFLFSLPAFADLYEIETRTCDREDAGTDSDVLIDIVGDRGRVQGFRPASPERNDFRRNQVDTYQVSASNIGVLRWLRINLSGTDGWCMESIRLRNLDTGRSWLWRYGSWIDTDSAYPATVMCRVGQRYCR
ncbi:PLAT/LH2 domain-containing protein [Polyangium sp. 15x6]|uniref:PLAT/LH2 domain-containing protein n=1 Tax=Polyangium sp. 15x6 TaxID=3042687 RepID=UPI00249C38D2|nr:PLAT/LH2 domain-containing protein [Polyangium sp. 15x6]MDI3284325.1 PLAT/LH2 domain-containing protein [Polyangium sp. 15x6]